MFELPKIRLFEKTRKRFRRKKKMAPSRPKKPVSPKVRYWLLVMVDTAIALLMRAITWGMIFTIAVLDIVAVFTILVVAFQDDLPTFVVDFVREYVFGAPQHKKLSLNMIDLDGIADMMRDGLKALGVLWITVSALTLGATVLTRYVWQRRTRKKLEAQAKTAGKLMPGEILVPLHDPLMLQMDDEFSRYVHLYAFYLDLRCRTAEDASNVARAMESLKAGLSAELVKMAEGQVVQVKRDDAITALSEAARAISGGGVVGVILRSSDYHRLKKPDSAVVATPPAGGARPKVKLTTSWGAKAYQDVAAAQPAEAPADQAPAAAWLPAADAPAAPAESPPPQPVDPKSLVAERARDVLAGLRG
jgi:hypothetical protein